MNITETLVRTVEKDGIILENRDEVYNSIDKAIEEGHFEFISNGKNNIGWFSWVVLPGEIYINNLFIEKKYRGTFNLKWGIRYLKSQYKGMGAFSWKNRRQNKEIRFKQTRIII